MYLDFSLKSHEAHRVWKYVHKKLDNKSKKQQIEDITVDGQVCILDSMTANYFNQYFSSVAVSLNSNALPPIHRQEIPNIAMNSQSIFFNPTNENEVLQIILNSKQKTGGIDDIHATVIKLAAPYIARMLTHNVNNIMVQGVCPR